MRLKSVRTGSRFYASAPGIFRILPKCHVGIHQRVGFLRLSNFEIDAGVASFEIRECRARRSKAGFAVGAAGICALRSIRLARFQRPWLLRTKLMLGSVALSVAISSRPRSRDRSRMRGGNFAARGSSAPR